MQFRVTAERDRKKGPYEEGQNKVRCPKRGTGTVSCSGASTGQGSREICRRKGLVNRAERKGAEEKAGPPV